MLVGSRNNILQIVFETNKLRQLFNKIFEKFLKAINHMEFHPTLGKEKKGTSYRLHRRSTKDREASMIHQMKYLSPDDIKMLRQGNEIIQKKYLKLNGTRHRTKRFGLATWVIRLGSVQKCTKPSGLLKEIYRPYMIRMFSKKNR